MDELVHAQAELARALGRARAGEDRDLAQRVRERGEQVVHLLTGLLKLTRVHAPENKAFDAPVAEFGKALAELVELLGTVHLVTVEDQIYVNDVRIRNDGKGSRDLGTDLHRHNTGGVSFHAPLDDRAVRALTRVLSAPTGGEAPRQVLAQRLREEGLTTVELAGIFRFRTEARRDERPSQDVVRRMLALFAEATANLGEGRVLNPLPLRRAVLEVLDRGLGAPDFWGGFPSDVPTHAVHALEVATVALATARTAGFPPAFLQDLGIAALIHDAGYLSAKVGGAQGMARHPLEGARIILRQRGFQEAKVLRLRAILEHHRDAATPRATPSAGGALLRLAEDYVNVVRLFGTRVLRADALGAMLRGGGTAYHPALAQVLVNTLGRHPPGTLLELEDGRVGRVAVPARSPELWETPLVRLIDPRTRQLTDTYADVADGLRVRRALPG